MLIRRVQELWRYPCYDSSVYDSNSLQGLNVYDSNSSQGDRVSWFTFKHWQACASKAQLQSSVPGQVDHWYQVVQGKPFQEDRVIQLLSCYIIIQINELIRCLDIFLYKKFCNSVLFRSLEFKSKLREISNFFDPVIPEKLSWLFFSYFIIILFFNDFI